MELIGRKDADRLGYRRLYGDVHEEISWRIVNEWEPKRDTLSLKYGYFVGMGLSAMTPWPLFSAFSKHFPLRKAKIGLGYSFRVLPVPILPPFVSGIMGIYNTGNSLWILFPCSHLLPASKGYFLAMKSVYVPNPLSKEFFYWSKSIFQRCHRSLSVIAIVQVEWSKIKNNRAMDKRRQMESEEYQNFLAETRNKKRNKILKALKRKKDMMDRSTKKINSLRAKYCQIPAFISRIHFDGLCRTKEDVLFLPEVKELFANVNNFEELIWATNHVILKLSDLGCFEDVFAEIDTDNSSRERYEVTFKMEEIGLIYLNPSLSNCTPYSNQSIRINPVISGKLLNIFGRAESLEGEFDRSNLSIFCEQMNYPNGNPYEQISEEKNLKMSASWFLANWWQHSLTFGASWRHLFVEPFKSISFNTREESGHSLKTSFKSLQVYMEINVSLGVGTSIGRLATPTIESDNTNLFYTENRITSLDRFETGGPLTTRGFDIEDWETILDAHHFGLSAPS
ncbi:SAM50 [Lepeophtheirus salmonis]|uniref:SAM50 n=1 Tax=Lepeophtheirus salmonis TaxID=72036 RepID=A0A7R8CD06_LEPSM|nr:SAM50 [Lepeophtheirus salmonis]CAF2774903.1 SAM50 [Lepeophtheirus salmonis]